MRIMLTKIITRLKYLIKSMSITILNIPWYCRFMLQEGSSTWKIYTHTTRNERIQLYRLALKQSHGAVAVEVGSYLGASASFLAAGLSKKKGTKLICVDTWRNDAMTEGTRDTFKEFHNNTSSYESMIFTKQGHSGEVANLFTEKIDLLFIDGDHSYAGCRSDVLAWLPKLKNNGIVIMHDYKYSPGVKKVVEELIEPRTAGKSYAMNNLYWTNCTYNN